MVKSNKLLYRPKENPSAALRIICFSYAGGSASVFHPWLNKLHIAAELVVCELPGRGGRLGEPPYQNMDSMLNDLVDAILIYTDKPFILFGHSMGSKVAYELMLLMRRKNLPEPVHFIASAATAPYQTRTSRPISKLSDPLFAMALSRLGGIPPAILKNNEFLSILLPALRADFNIVETYINTSMEKILGNLTIMGGLNDLAITSDGLLSWTSLASKGSKVLWLDGGHFFIKEHTIQVVNLINRIVSDEHQFINAIAV